MAADVRATETAADVIELGRPAAPKEAGTGWKGLRSAARAVVRTAKRGSVMLRWDADGIRTAQEALANQVHQKLSGRDRKSIKISENSFLRRKKLRVKAAHMHLLKQVAHRRACHRTPAARGP